VRTGLRHSAGFSCVWPPVTSCLRMDKGPPVVWPLRCLDPLVKPPIVRFEPGTKTKPKAVRQAYIEGSLTPWRLATSATGARSAPCKIRTDCSSVNLARLIIAPQLRGAIASKHSWLENPRTGHHWYMAFYMSNEKSSLNYLTVLRAIFFIRAVRGIRKVPSKPVLDCAAC